MVGRDVVLDVHKDPATPGDVVLQVESIAAPGRSQRGAIEDVSFEVGGKVRSAVTLKVGKSWSWRTWAYNTMRSDDRKPLRLLVKDDQGKLVLDKTLPIIPE